GLLAIEPPLPGANPAAAVRSRASQVLESGIHTSGTTALPLAWPTPASATPCWLATTAATSTGSMACTWTLTQMPSTAAPSLLHCVAAASTAGAISGAAATLRVNCPSHWGPVNRWYPYHAPANTTARTTAVAM